MKIYVLSNSDMIQSDQSCIPAFADTLSAKVECTALVEAAVEKWRISASQRFLEMPVRVTQ